MLTFSDFIRLDEKTQYAMMRYTDGATKELPYLVLDLTDKVDAGRFELKKFMNNTRAGIARFWIYDGKVYVWDSYDYNHKDFFDMTGVPHNGSTAPKLALYVHEVSDAYKEMSLKQFFSNPKIMSARNI